MTQAWALPLKDPPPSLVGGAQQTQKLRFVWWVL